MIMHGPGTTIPGSPTRAEFLRTYMYLPPAFLRRHPDSQPVIAQIVQTFIESVGVPTVIAWAEDARAHGWRLTQSAGIIHPNSVPDTLIIPLAKPPASYKTWTPTQSVSLELAQPSGGAVQMINCDPCISLALLGSTVESGCSESFDETSMAES
ncbi:hypothetical protein B0H14DRAFT_3730678 [Mycena olivaceomarginata]|nr:hypothetical protein B0H14DRAFT_3730678 [Mycena olivaceomarginata]